MILRLRRHARPPKKRRDVAAVAAVRLPIGVVERRPVSGWAELSDDPAEPYEDRCHGHILRVQPRLWPRPVLVAPIEREHKVEFLTARILRPSHGADSNRGPFITNDPPPSRHGSA